MSTAKERGLMRDVLDAWEEWLDEDEDGHFEELVRLIEELAVAMGLDPIYAGASRQGDTHP